MNVNTTSDMAFDMQIMEQLRKHDQLKQEVLCNVGYFAKKQIRQDLYFDIMLRSQFGDMNNVLAPIRNAIVNSL